MFLQTEKKIEMKRNDLNFKVIFQNLFSDKVSFFYHFYNYAIRANIYCNPPFSSLKKRNIKQQQI